MKLVLASLTDDFDLTVLHHIEQVYHNDGGILLWIMCNIVHCSNIAFTETSKTKTRESTLTNFDNVEKYISFIKNSLSLITHC